MADYGFKSLADIPLEKVSDTFSRRSLIGDKEMVVWASTKAGCHAAAHRHPHEQIFWVLSGEMLCRLESEMRTCRTGDVLFVPPNAEHEMWCQQDTEFVTMLAPPRVDLMPGAELPEHLKQA